MIHDLLSETDEEAIDRHIVTMISKGINRLEPITKESMIRHTQLMVRLQRARNKNWSPYMVVSKSLKRLRQKGRIEYKEKSWHIVHVQP